jgi:hypothetical protein
MSEFATNMPQEQDPTFPYISPCMRCQPIIDHTSIHYNNSEESFPLKLFSEPEWKFGIFNLHIRSEIPITHKHLHIFFTIDGSGSMSDICVDGRTKMQHIHYTLENMIRIFHENPECNVSIHVQSFDTKIEKHIQDVSNIKEENLESLINKIQKIRPGGSTNIEVALNSATQQITEYKLAYPEHEVVHLFLTDGEITNGSSDMVLLKTCVPDDCTNIFIGYGLEHDSQLLSFLGNKKDNDYRFIDALEKAGIVYGEIIHGILYKAIADVTIKPYGCEIYDFQTNEWSDELMIGNLLSEQKKTYHIRSKTPETGYISVLGRTIVKTKQFQILSEEIEEQTNVHPGVYLFETNLTIYMFRQRTQELLYEARQYSEKINRNVLSIRHSDVTLDELPRDINTVESEKTIIKNKLSDFRSLMLKYMKDNHMETEPIMKMLCDDIYICILTIGTTVGNMFSCARQTSQGRQETYACSAVNSIDDSEQTIHLQTSRPPLIPNRGGVIPLPRLVRQTNCNNNIDLLHIIYDQTQDPEAGMSVEPEPEPDVGLLSQDILTPYSSNGIVNLMRAVSGNVTLGDEDVTLGDEDVTLGDEYVTLGDEDVTLGDEDVTPRIH